MGLLSLAIWTPIAFGVMLLALGRDDQAQAVRWVALVGAVVSLLVTLPLAWLEPGAMQWHPDLLIALVWSVLVLTLGGSSLLMVLIQRGAATRVTSLLYLVPPCTALLAWWLFGERMATTGWAGMALCAIGVGLVLRSPAR